MGRWNWRSVWDIDMNKLRLSPRQRDVLPGLQTGMSNREIAHQLGISPLTVKFHVSVILCALGCERRAQIPDALRRIGSF